MKNILILIIATLGIMSYTQAREIITAGNDDFDRTNQIEMQQFNEKFMQYDGDRVRGATVNSMLQSVVAHNLSADDDSKQIIVTGTGIANGISLDKNSSSVATKAKTGSTYSVTCKISDGTDANGGKGNKGLVYEIAIGDPK